MKFVDRGPHPREGRRRRQRRRRLPPGEVHRARRPRGGDGGNGGSVIFEADPQLTTLLDYRYQQHHRARNGQHGMGSDCNGRGAEDLSCASRWAR